VRSYDSNLLISGSCINEFVKSIFAVLSTILLQISNFNGRLGFIVSKVSVDAG